MIPDRRSGSQQLFRFICAVALCAASTVSTGQEPDPVWHKPIQIGGVAISLHPPSMDDSMDAAQQQAGLQTVAGKYPLDRFLKESIVSPFHLERENIKNEVGERVGHRIDLWFVAHGPLEAIQDQDLFAEMIGADDSSGGAQPVGDSPDSSAADAGRRLTEAEVAERGLYELREPGLTLGYYRFSADVIDRVVVEGVVLGLTRNSPRSQFAGMHLEEQFEQDKDFPNRWRHRDAAAEEARPYRGLAGYAKATRLLEHGDAILVECHAVIHEPPEWFSGANLLSSKLPLVVQDSVRSFRRNLAKHR